jgi:hypothetical protein
MHTLAILSLLVLAGPAQRIETQYPDRGKVTRLETAMNHLTVIELSDAVTLAAAGSPLFKIERRDNKVFIQPLEEGAATNLFVWTESGRWTYELVPAASIESTHFAIDQKPAPPLEGPNTNGPGSAAFAAPASQSFAEEMLLFAKAIRNLGTKSEANQLGAFITDVFRRDGQLFIRYVIDNRTTRPYRAAMPDVFALQGVKAKSSLHTYRYSQIGSDIAKDIRSRSETPVEIIDCELPSEPLPPGQLGTGILTVRLPEPTSLELDVPQVLRVVFPSNGGKPISVIVVL